MHFIMYTGHQFFTLIHFIIEVIYAIVRDYLVVVSNTYRDDISEGYSIPDEKPTVGYSIPDEIPTNCFQLCELV